MQAATWSPSPPALPLTPWGELSPDASVRFRTLVERSRSWCPFIQPALDANQFLTADWRPWPDLKLAALVEVASRALEAASTGGAQPLWVLTALLSDRIGGEEDEVVLQELRSPLLDRGQMAGLLHPRSPHRSLKRAREGFPYRIGDVFLTIRWANHRDHVFVDKNPELLRRLERWCDSPTNSAKGDGE